MSKWLVLGVLALASFQARSEEPRPVEWTYGFLFANWKPGDKIAPIALGLSGDPDARSQLTLDLAAEFLARASRIDGLNGKQARTIADFVGRTKSGRYRQVFEHILAEGRVESMRSTAYDYIREHKRKNVEQYVPGSIDFAAMAKRHFEQSLAAVPTLARAEALAAMKEGSTIDELFAAAGFPQQVTARSVHLSEHASFQRLLFHFRGLGRATFRREDVRGWVLQSTIVDALAFEGFMPYRVDAAKLGMPDEATLRMMQIASGSMVASAVAIDAVHDSPPATLEFLDATAQLLNDHYQVPAHDPAEDVVAWAARLLVENGGLRYAKVLDEARGAKSQKLQTYAKKKILPQTIFTTTPYVPDSVPLTELARKYPSLYPDITLRRGHL
jgi:hypothetical protein